MKLTRYRSARAAGALALALAFAAGATGLLGGAAAQAQEATSGTLEFSGDAGDYISGGQSYSYSTDAQDRLDVTADSDHQHVSVAVTGAHGDWWYLDLAAPQGQALEPGTYEGATRYPFNGPAEPGLSLDGNGRGCNTLTGSFTVSKADFGPNGYVEALDATYEQHCEGGTAALRGEVHIANPAPPATLDLGIAVAPDGTASTLNGKATVHGTVSCNKPVRIDVTGNVTQVKKGVIVRGSYSTSVDCAPGDPVAWTAQADPSGTTPFRRGDVEVSAQARASDPDYAGQSATDSQTVAVHLVKG
ncbi:hypothetical protein GCM10018793_59420 [Streptomyces sulfonofaciens]|uniref:Uncharacterized protein n=1 Tax=Streptomyces sulfonofaciens TaxID=68272 RepID=A0A919L7B6_9ACTN|nr:hypothetical protein [Streptomyces sulfonofaciens]GHH86637.1 hypothetical protein GCM10018793_59420 [Streptomyces sulfonofaciens]